jgi:hypothetical protein
MCPACPVDAELQRTGMLSEIVGGDYSVLVTHTDGRPCKIKKAESLGEPHNTAEDGCRAWVSKKP